MKTEDYEAKFQPSEDDENMKALANDLASLMHNSNFLGRACKENQSRMATLDNIIAKMTEERIEMEKRLDGLEDYLFRGKDNAK